MENKVLMLLVMAIIAVLLLLLFLFFFAPLYLWSERPGTVVEKQLRRAETDLGHYHHQPSSFPDEFTVKADGFESKNRSIKFECNMDYFCCSEGEDCEKPIEWDNKEERRYFSFKQPKPVEVSARCRHEEIYICRVYIGEEPAQVKISEMQLEDSELDLMQKKTTKIKYRVENTGQKDMIGVQGVARLYSIKKLPFDQEPEKTLVREFKDEEFALSVGEEAAREVELYIGESGDYEIEFTVFETIDETNYETKKAELKATGELEIGECIPGPMEKEYYSREECRYFLPCEDCKSLEECERKWREKFNIPENIPLILKKYDEIAGSIWIQVPGEHRRECRRQCYPEYEVVSELETSEKPIDLVFVIDASGSMSDDIDEVRGVIEEIQEVVGEGCRIGQGDDAVLEEACLQIGVYLFEGSFKDCYYEDNPFFEQCLLEERGRTNPFQYDSYNYVACETVEIRIMEYYKKLVESYNQLISGNVPLGDMYGRVVENSAAVARQLKSKIERDLGSSTLQKSFPDFIPPNCRPADTRFSAPDNRLQGIGSDIGYIPVTTDFRKISRALDEVLTTQGTEAWADALWFAITAEEMDWRDNSEKAVIIITDAANNPNYLFSGGAEKTIPQVGEEAKSKGIKIFGLAAKGNDQFDPALGAEVNRYLTDFFGFPMGITAPASYPDYDLQQIADRTGGSFHREVQASELPQEILDIVKTEVQRASGEHGLNICEEGEVPEICDEYCVLPWEEMCADCTCFKYYDEHLEEYSMLDIAFVMDASGSMQGEIDTMRQRISEIISGVQAECERVGVEKCMRIGIRFLYGQGTQNLPLTADKQEAQNRIASAFAGGGKGDEKEPWAGEALIALESDNWYTQSKKMIFIITDAANDPEEVVLEDYRGRINSAAESAEIDAAIVELKNVARDNGFRIFSVYSEESTQSPKAQLEWLAEQTGASAVEYSKGDDFSTEITAAIVRVLRGEFEKPWCSDDQCANCAERAFDTTYVPLEFAPDYMCSDNSLECRVFLTCYDDEVDITLGQCEELWKEKVTNPSIETLQDLGHNWLYVEGVKTLNGEPVGEGEEWDECVLPKVVEEWDYCGGKTLKKGENMLPDVEEYESPWITVPEEETQLDSDGDGIPDEQDLCKWEKETINGFEDEDGCPDTVPEEEKCSRDSECADLDCGSVSCPENAEAQGKCIDEECGCECPVEEAVEASEDELECMQGLDCYCPTTNDNWEYIQRVKEAGTPVDFFIVLDATRNMHTEITAFKRAFTEMLDAMMGECKLESGEPCVKAGVLVFGGANSALLNLFQGMSGSGNEALDQSLGTFGLSSSETKLGDLKSAVAGIAYMHEEEPWADAIVYAIAPANKERIGWRDGSAKAILLITSETDKSTNYTVSEAANAMLRDAFFYALTRNLGVDDKNPYNEAKIIDVATRGSIYAYNVPSADPLELEIENIGRKEPFADSLKIIFKDLVESLIEKERCQGNECSDPCGETE